jgi:hypothetical protein
MSDDFLQERREAALTILIETIRKRGDDPMFDVVDAAAKSAQAAAALFDELRHYPATPAKA